MNLAPVLFFRYCRYCEPCHIKLFSYLFIAQCFDFICPLSAPLFELVALINTASE
jgi:hypothetical protein